MAIEEEQSYTDEKGRTRWHSNETLARQLKQLGDFLIIGGYEESHAVRYGKLAYVISRHPEPIMRLHQEKRLSEIPGVGETIIGIIGELLETGTCAKQEEWATHTPKTVLQMTAIPGLGVKTVRTLYHEHKIDSLTALRAALDAGILAAVPGLGAKTREAIRQYLSGEINTEE